MKALSETLPKNSSLHINGCGPFPHIHLVHSARNLVVQADKCIDLGNKHRQHGNYFPRTCVVLTTKHLSFDKRSYLQSKQSM